MICDPEEHDPDALAEYAAAQVGLDGLTVRDAEVFLRALVPTLRVLPASAVEACFDPDTCIVRVNPFGGRWSIKTRLIHELGHVILWVNGIGSPHDERLCTRTGQAAVIGRRGLVLKLQEMPMDRVVAAYAGTMHPGDVLARAGYVQGQMIRLRQTG